MRKITFSLLLLFLTITSFSQNHTSDSISRSVAKAQIEKYRDRVIKGEKMADLAIMYSEDPGSAGKGGMYRNVKKGVMDPAFENVAFSLKQGQISKVFETPYGYHFIQLVQRKGDLLDLRHILIVPKFQK
jgi:peptidyl-prolyl cis-trans isomerase SurA